MTFIASALTAAALALAAASEGQSTPPAQTIAAAPASTTAPADDGDTVVCKSIEVTGTRFSTRECKTKTQWADITRNARDYVDRSTMMKGGAPGH